MRRTQIRQVSKKKARQMRRERLLKKEMIEQSGGVCNECHQPPDFRGFQNMRLFLAHGVATQRIEIIARYCVAGAIVLKKESRRRLMNNRINLPFLKEFEDRILGGQKTVTTRTKIMGEPLDWFEAFGRTFIITDVQRVCLWEVTKSYYKQEGFRTPNEFIAIWKQIHPRMGYKPEKKVYLHIFKSQGELAIPHLHLGNPCEICHYPICEEAQDD